MPFPEPDERPGEDLRLRTEFGVLLAVQLIILAAGARYLWHSVMALF